MDFCIQCGGYGLYGEECPRCGKSRKALQLSRIGEQEIEMLEQRMDYVSIPDNYKGVEWSYDIFWSCHPEFIDDEGRKDRELDSKVDFLTKVNSLYGQGALPPASIIYVSPPHMGKMVWAYSCMQHALKNGYTVAPIYDTLELAGFLSAGSRNPRYRLYNKLTLEEYMLTDVVFITVSKTDYRKEAHYVIREILDRRARLGKGTNFISEFGIEEFASSDDTGYIFRILDRNLKNINGFKVPSYLAFKEPSTKYRRGERQYVKHY